MFNDENEDYIEVGPLIQKFEEMLKKKTSFFFDVDEFEAISDYYYETGSLVKALKASEIATEQHPYCSNFGFRRAQYYTASNRIAEAKKELESLEKSHDNSQELFLAKAAIASKEGLHNLSINFFKESLKGAEFPEDIWPLMANEYQMAGNYELALKYYKQSLEQNPEDEISIYNLTLCLDFLDKNSEGISFFKKLINKNPYSEVSWYHLAMIYAKEKEYDKAIWAIDYSLLIDDEFTAAYFEKARILERTYQFQEAANTYEQSFDFEDPIGFTFYKIGLCYLRMHRHEKALSYFTKAVHEDDDLDEAHFELSLIFDENLSFTEAVHAIKKAIALDPENIEYLNTSASIFRRAGLLNEAELVYENILELGHMGPAVFIDYAELLFDLCEFNEGLEVLYQGVQLNPESSEMNYRLAGYLYTLQESDEAGIYFKKALDIDPDRKNFFLSIFPKLHDNKDVKVILGRLKHS